MQATTMQTAYQPTGSAQVIAMTSLRDNKIETTPFASNNEHLEALENEAKFMVAVAALRRGKLPSEDLSEQAPCFAFLKGADLDQAVRQLENISTENRRREELSRQGNGTLNFLEFCDKWDFDPVERQIVQLLLMQFSSPTFYAVYQSSGLERNCDNGMEIGAILSIISRDLGDQLEYRRYFSIKGKFLKNELLMSNCQCLGSTTSILRISAYLHERYVRHIVGDTNQYHIAFKFIKQERSNLNLDQVVLPAPLKQEVILRAERFIAGRRSGAFEHLDDFFSYGTGLAFIFYGPSGTGKTMLAKALANHLSCPLVSLNAEDLENIPMSNDEIMEILFREAALIGGIVFLDECDDIFGSNRNSQLSRSLLLEIEKSRCITILATNRPVELDPAMERRLAMKVHFTIPDSALRLQMWKALMPCSVRLAADVDLIELASRYQFTGGLIRNSIFLAIAATTSVDNNRHLLTSALLHSAAEKQAATLADESGLCRMYPPTVNIDSLPLRSRQRAELKNLGSAWKSLNSRKLGLSLLISSSDIATGILAAEGLAEVCGLKVRSFDYRRVISIVDNDRVVDPETQRKVLPIDYAFSPTACDASLTLFVDYDGFMQQKHGDKNDDSFHYLMLELAAKLRGYNGFFCMVTKDVESSSAEQFNLHIDLDYPPEERQISQWEYVLGKKRMSDDDLVRLVENHPMHLMEIDDIARQAEIMTTIKGNLTGKPSLAEIYEVITRQHKIKSTPLLFGNK